MHNIRERRNKFGNDACLSMKKIGEWRDRINLDNFLYFYIFYILK